MRVEVRLFATLGAYLPSTASRDSVHLDLPAGATVGAVMASLGIPGDLECLKVVNGLDADPDHPLTDGDVVTVCPPLVGGA
jgi:molybdopterin converting factor small subunit